MEPILLFEVTNQLVTRKDNFNVVAKSKNYLTAKFSFLTPEWEGEKIAIFGSIHGIYKVLLEEDDTCLVPWETLKTAGSVYVSVFCGDLVTANKALFRVGESGYRPADEGMTPTPDIYHQILLKKGLQPLLNAGEHINIDAETNTISAEQYDDTAIRADIEKAFSFIRQLDETTYTKAQVDKLVEDAKPQGYESLKTDVQTLKEEAQTLETDKADKSTTYTKTEVDTKISQATPTDYAEVKASVEKNTSDITKVEQGLVGKLDTPSNPVVGKVLKIKSVNDDGTFVCEWAEPSRGNVNDVQIDGTSILDTNKNANFESSDVKTMNADFVKFVEQNLTPEQKAQAKANIDATRITNVWISRNWTKSNFDLYSAFGRIESWTAPIEGVVIGDIFTIYVTITDCADLNGYIMVQVTDIKKDFNSLVGKTLFACTRYVEKAILTESEQLSARQRIGIDKEWEFKGAITTENKDGGCIVDLTGCTELYITGNFTATATGCDFYNNYGRMIYNMSRNATSYVRILYGNLPIRGIYPMSARFSSSDIIQGDTFTTYTQNIENISAITKLYFTNASLITNCNLSVYAR